jgi:hypothetical protein
MIESERRWTVYGRVKTGLDATGVVQFRGLHLDRAKSLDEANAFVEDALATHGPGRVECVIVVLKYGVDVHNERAVIRRLNNFNAWWE